MNPFLEEIKGKKVLVFGLGRQGGGTGDRDWLIRHGATVRISDKDLAQCPEGQTKEQIDWSEIIIKNPGVSDDHELIVYAKSRNIPVYTSIAVFNKYADIIKIGVTGTRGKSTTVGLITSLLNSAFPGQVISGGNIAGTSCLELFDHLDGKKYAVLELSSFQLHNFHDLRVSPNIAVITNLYPDHLNRYHDMEDYRRDKEAIVLYQQSGDTALFNEDNFGANEIGLLGKGKRITYSADNVSNWTTSLPGLHNRENIAAMWAVGQLLGIEESMCRSIAKNFVGLPFRQEKIRELNGIVYINDTTATTPVAAIKALQAAMTPTIWITGGDTKNLPFDKLLKEIEHNQKIKNIVILGSKNIPEYTSALENLAKDKIVGRASTMQEAIDLAQSVASDGDTILLSPGFASFDLFQNEFDRGRQFNEIVNRL